MRVSESERQRQIKQYRDALGPRPMDLMHADRLDWPAVWKYVLRPYAVAGLILGTGVAVWRLIEVIGRPFTTRMLVLPLMPAAGFLCGIALATALFGGIRVLVLLDRWLTSRREGRGPW